MIWRYPRQLWGQSMGVGLPFFGSTELGRELQKLESGSELLPGGRRVEREEAENKGLASPPHPPARTRLFCRRAGRCSASTGGESRVTPATAGPPSPPALCEGLSPPAFWDSTSGGVFL